MTPELSEEKDSQPRDGIPKSLEQRVYDCLPEMRRDESVSLKERMKDGVESVKITRQLGQSHTAVKNILKMLRSGGYAQFIHDDETNGSRWFRTNKPFLTVADEIKAHKGRGGLRMHPLSTRMLIMKAFDGRESEASIRAKVPLTPYVIRNHLEALTTKGFLAMVQRGGTGEVCPTCHRPIDETAYEITKKGSALIKEWAVFKDVIDEVIV